jgi:hypothetical protein
MHSRKLIYHACIHTSMARRVDVKNVHLRFSQKEHATLLKKKHAAGLTWEEWILRIAGIEDE